MNKTRRIELNIGHNILAALINADKSGLSESDIKAIDQAILDYGPYFHAYMPESEEKNFSRCDISGLFDDCYIVEVEVSTK